MSKSAMTEVSAWLESNTSEFRLELNTVTGFSSYPFERNQYPQLDGVVIDWRVIPDGNRSIPDTELTLAHQVGHWLGLYHTFEVSKLTGILNKKEG